MNSAMPNRRLFLATLLAASAFMVGAANAQGRGNGGNGNGNGNSGGGNGNGNGNAGGGKGKGNGNSGGKATAAPGQAPAAPATETEERAKLQPDLRLRHGNGFEEEIGAGRYEMRDDRGRLIVNRAARDSDYARLRRLMRQ